MKKQVQLFFLLFAVIVITILVLVATAIFKKNWIEFLYVSLGVIGFDLICFLIYILVKIFYWRIVIVTDDEIIEYINKKVVFRIKKEQIVELLFYRMPVVGYILDAIGILIKGIMTGVGVGPGGDELSIRFYSAEVETQGIKLISQKMLVEEEGKLLKEHTLHLSYKQIVLLSQKLNVPLKAKYQQEDKKEPETKDWRILNYDGHLNNKTFTYAEFKSTAKNDHEHCEFCWKKITDLDIPNEECDRDGYYILNENTNQTNWICKKCFEDFKDRFNFKQVSAEYCINYILGRANDLIELTLNQLPDFARDNIANDIANEWEIDYYKYYIDTIKNNGFNTIELEELIQEISSRFDEVSFGKINYNEQLWTKEAFINSDFWNAQREIAQRLRNCLLTMLLSDQ